MENDEVDGEHAGTVKSCTDYDERGVPALNSTILDYYKKFGRKRDLEQYFSLSTAQSEIRDPTSLFWRRIKAMSDSSDSGEKRSESPTELCRISIKCSMAEQESSSSHDKNTKTKSDSESPPIITEDVQADDPGKQSDNESVKSDNASQKSLDATLDTSMNKLLSPSSSITSQRKLEWDSLADVGYANENDQKNSASSLSTLERLALKQQYSNNDTQNTNIGVPTAHSTPLDENDSKNKGKIMSKTTKIFRKDTDFLQVNVPHGSDMNTPINVNLTRHISFNVDGHPRVTRHMYKEHASKDVSVRPETIPVTFEEANSQIKMDKEIQTSLTKPKAKSSSSVDMTKSVLPVLINLNTLRRKRRKKVHQKKSKQRIKRKEADKENISLQEKSGEQVSEAESFEYMPGHIYNQNQMKNEESKSRTTAGNKSSLESSGNFTTDSSKGSKHSFTKDLQKSVHLLKATLNRRYDDSNLKRKLIKEVVQRLLNSNYRDDESTTDFLSGLSFGSAKLGLTEATTTTTSTSEANTAEKKPKKSILRREKFNSSLIASTSQSAPNLPSVANSEKPVNTTLRNPLLSSNTESESSRDKVSSDTAFVKTSSEELYQKYLDALKKEQAYKKHLKEKEMFLRQKLVCSDTAIKMPAQLDSKSQIKLKELMKDLTRNNYDDGSGDASKLECGSSSNQEQKFIGPRKQRSHSVFTLSSNECQCSNRRANSRKPPAKENNAGSSRAGVGVTDSATQVDIKHQNEESNTKKPCNCNKVSPRNVTHYISDSNTGDIKYVCLCPENTDAEDGSEKILVYKCSRLTNKVAPIPEQVEKACKLANTKPANSDAAKPGPSDIKRAAKITILRTAADNTNKMSKSSQTNLAKLFNEKSKKKAHSCSSSNGDYETEKHDDTYIHEATRQLQTEISINPRISDPSLCDIKIISDADCAIFISEQYRQVSKSSLEKTSSENGNEDLNMLRMGSEISDETSVSSENKEKRRQLRKMTYTRNSVEETVPDQVLHFDQEEEIQDNLTIPIQGTNMTLMVKIGQNAHKPQEDLNKFAQGHVSAKQSPKSSPRSNQGRQNKGHGDSAKSYHVNTLFAKDKFSFKAEDTPSDASKNVEKGCGIQNDLLDDFFATESKKFDEDEKDNREERGKPIPGSSTYPKVQPKPFFRSNTDTKRFSDFKAPKICKCGCLEPDCECDQVCELEEKKEIRRHASTETFENEQFFRPIESIESVSPKASDHILPQISPKELVCPCPAPAPCENLCDETAECFKDAPKSQHYESLHRKSPGPIRKSPTLRISPRKLNNKQLPRETAPIQHLSKTMKIGEPNYPKLNKPMDYGQKRYDPIDYGQRPYKPDLNQNFDECPCPEGAACGRTCDETADCYPRKPTGRPEIVSGNLEKDFFYKPLAKPPKSYYQRSTTDEEIECARPVMLRSGIDTEASDNEYPTKQKSEKDSFMQTEPMDIRGFELKNPSSSDPSEDKHVSAAKGIPAFKQVHSDDQSSKKSSDNDNVPQLETPKDFIMELINDITKRYTKKDIQKIQRKKCFNEIMKILNYLLETEDPDQNLLQAMQNATAGATDSVQDIKNKLAYHCGANFNFMTESGAASCSKTIKTGSSTEKQDVKKPEKTYADKGIQLCPKKSRSGKVCCTESSDVPVSSECACTSSDAPTCRVLDKIRKECEKYHQKRCKSSHSSRKCETSSSTSVNCEKCKRTHHCHCRTHKCKSKAKLIVDKVKKKSVAYNLIIQTSESMISEEASFNQGVPLRNIIVKVPPKRKLENMPFKEAEAKIGSHMSSPRCLGRYQRSRSLPNESGISSDEARRMNVYSVKDYLERNRPDFLEQATRRQNCLKMISENRNQVPCSPPRLKMVVVHHPNGRDNCAGCTQPVTMYCEGVPIRTKCTCTDPYNMHMMQKEVTIAKDREVQRELLSLQLLLQQDRQPPMSAYSETDLRQLARDLGADLRRKKEAPKFISEREMKKHSEKIYKSLPEVVRKKEEMKKQNIKKTNLLMATIFNKNLQKKTLRGTVNLSNYSNVVKI